MGKVVLRRLQHSSILKYLESLINDLSAWNLTKIDEICRIDENGVWKNFFAKFRFRQIVPLGLARMVVIFHLGSSPPCWFIALAFCAWALKIDSPLSFRVVRAETHDMEATNQQGEDEIFSVKV